jgi:hypothetical protein
VRSLANRIARLPFDGSRLKELKLSDLRTVQAGSIPFSHFRTFGVVRNPGATTCSKSPKWTYKSLRHIGLWRILPEWACGRVFGARGKSMYPNFPALGSSHAATGLLVNQASAMQVSTVYAYVKIISKDMAKLRPAPYRKAKEQYAFR